MLPKDKIIADIAAKHKLRLDNDDPILVTLSLNEAILGEAIIKIEDVITKHEEKFNVAHDVHIKQFKHHSEALINKAAIYLEKTLTESCDEKLKSLNTFIERAETLYKKIVTLAILSVILVCSAVIVTLLGML
jgi:hypothetical protein